MPSKRTSTDQRGKVVNHNYTPRSYKVGGYKNFEEFYPFYLGEHCDRTNRRLHLIGTTNAFLIALCSLIFQMPLLILAAAVQGYAFSWTGHFFFEKNKPATFQHPFYSIMGDFRMWWEVVTGLRSF